MEETLCYVGDNFRDSEIYKTFEECRTNLKDKNIELGMVICEKVLTKIGIEELKKVSEQMQLTVVYIEDPGNVKYPITSHNIYKSPKT